MCTRINDLRMHHSIGQGAPAARDNTIDLGRSKPKYRRSDHQFGTEIRWDDA